MPLQVRQGLALVAVAAAVYLTGLGSTRLWDDDETYFAQTAREMFDRGDLIVPWFNQTLFAHKPPFMYWMMIGAFHLLGVTEFASRLPSAAFGMASALLVWRLGRILYSPQVGFWAGIVLATSLNYIVIARAATCDAELLFFCTLPIYFFVRNQAVRRLVDGESAAQLVWLDEDACRPTTWKTWTLLYASMGLAVMVKGPIGVVLPTAVLGLFLLLQHAKRPVSAHSPILNSQFSIFNSQSSPSPTSALGVRLRVTIHATWHFLSATFAPRHILRTIWAMRPLTAIAMTLLVAGPWFVAVSIRTRGEFLEGFFGIHHFHRFTATMDNHSGPAVYYLLAICVGFFPWSIFLSPTCLELARRMRDPQSSRPADRLIVAWFTVWVGLFSLAVTKFPHYVIPAYPALALGTACFLDRWIRDVEIYPKFWRRAAWATVGLVGLGIVVVVPFVASVHLPGEQLLALTGLPLIPGAILCAWYTERRQITRALASLTATAVVFSIGLFAVAAVRVDSHQNTPPFAAAIHERCPAGDARIAVYQYFRPGFVFYCNERVEQFSEAAPAVKFLSNETSRSFLVTTVEEYERMAESLPPRIGVIERSPWFLKSGTTLVLLGDTTARISARPVDQRR
ncbi:MAG TPA: glycosyltransferase family 39 protein [Planctomycetaceae bacterium]|jgi:4-amino-4-deoxy-L-arabinose transferase-like glycosyltransferase